MTASENLDVSALIKSILVHVTVITLCLVSWQCSEPRLVKMPAHVKAVVVSKGSLADRPMMKSKPQEKPPKKIQDQPKKPEPVKQPPKKVEPPKQPPKPPEPPKPEKKPDPPKQVQKKPEPPKKEPQKKPEPPKKPPKKPEPPKKPDFSDLIDEELDALEKPTKPTKAADAPSASTSPVVDKYLAGIRADIERRWTRPPLSRNGMKVTLRIYLLPGGELNDVQVVVSSGNASFDRSALTAVQKVGRFTVPSDPVEFDQNFRQFTVLFNPDDLTY